MPPAAVMPPTSRKLKTAWKGTKLEVVVTLARLPDALRHFRIRCRSDGGTVVPLRGATWQHTFRDFLCLHYWQLARRMCRARHGPPPTRRPPAFAGGLLVFQGER